MAVDGEKGAKCPCLLPLHALAYANLVDTSLNAYDKMFFVTRCVLLICHRCRPQAKTQDRGTVVTLHARAHWATIGRVSYKMLAVGRRTPRYNTRKSGRTSLQPAL